MMKQPKIITLADKLLSGLESIQPFPESEAWKLYRLAAYCEAFGWTVLLVGIAVHHWQLPGKGIAIPIAGQVHGTLFLIYFGILAATYTSLRWSRLKFLVAILAGVPPYGSLLFEQWTARTRRNRLSKQHYRTILFSTITQSA
jgi:integral membrane protein